VPNETVRCVLAALHSYTHTTWIRVWGSGSLVTCGVKMMSLRHGWGWQPPQTAFHIHIRHMQCVWAHWHAVHWHTSAVLHSFTHPTWLRFWVGVALVKPTTSYFWFLVTFHHNLDLWSCCRLQELFFEMSSRASKNNPQNGRRWRAAPKCQ